MGSHQMFVSAALSPQTLNCTNGWGWGQSVPPQSKRLWSRDASWEETEQGELTPLCFHPSHPGHREAGHCPLHTWAGSTDQASTAIPAQLEPARIRMLQTMGTESSTVLRVSAGIWVGSCLLSAPHDVKVREPDVFGIPFLPSAPGPHARAAPGWAKGVFDPRTGDQGSLAPGLVKKSCFAPNTE